LPPVEYEYETIGFEDDSQDHSTMILDGPLSELYDMESRPMQSFDQIFEKKVQKRLAIFHAKPIDRT
jgi:hypothetical protein